MNTLNNTIQQIVQALEPSVDKVIVQDSVYPDTITYICYADAGTPQDVKGWRIIRVKSVSAVAPTKDTVSSPYDVERGVFSALNHFICSERENYAYSQDN